MCGGGGGGGGMRTINQEHTVETFKLLYPERRAGNTCTHRPKAPQTSGELSAVSNKFSLEWSIACVL